MKKFIDRLLLIFIPYFLVTACAIKIIPPEQQYRSFSISAPFQKTYKAIKPALMKNGYKILTRDITVGLVKAKKINRNKYLEIMVKPKSNQKSFVNIQLIVEKNGRRLGVSKKSMTEIETILDNIKTIVTS